ncbi:hypothetical protein BJX63DRAFT_190501 [Aspergillus granulosus]|uniref:Cyanovirin-N domain-containing protein n=1 Tax=Aspergillus granulosus TaxID=176169 RepID=A0ABR4HH76_9EURO
MARRSNIVHLFLLFIIFASFALASSPASFCKCTCFSNSTIIPLDPDKGDSSSFNNAFHFLTRSEDIDSSNDKRAGNYRSLSCNDCNRKFCLGYDLPTCKGAKEEDVLTTCFRMLRSGNWFTHAVTHIHEANAVFTV